MKDVKDIFSNSSAEYARFRPSYPAAYFDYLYSLVTAKAAAWDCGTGNGQIAKELATQFDVVYATDISQNQLDNAIQKPNIKYSLERAEATTLADNSIDLITVAQAIHWFDFEAFYKEVSRVAKDKAIVAASTYSLVQINENIDKVISKLYEHIAPYWDKERHYIDEEYATIPFPFEEIAAPAFEIKLHWTQEQLLGYLNTWSSVQHYIKKNNKNPLMHITSDLQALWPGNETREMTFPLFARIGRINR